MPKFTSTTAIGNSNFYDSGGNFCIGTTTATGTLTLFATPNSATPANISFGTGYGQTASDFGQLQLKLYHDGSGAYGLGVTGGSLNIMTYATAIHAFYNGSTLVGQFNASGNFGVGATPTSYKCDINGSCHATSFPTSSDARFKKNVRPLTDSLQKITQLEGVIYEWNEFVNSRRDGYRLNVPTVGLIAQDVEKIIPEIIDQWELSPDCKDARSIDYPRIVPYLIEAIKEQQVQITTLSNRLLAVESGSSN